MIYITEAKKVHCFTTVSLIETKLMASQAAHDGNGIPMLHGHGEVLEQMCTLLLFPRTVTYLHMERIAIECFTSESRNLVCSYQHTCATMSILRSHYECHIELKMH